MCAPGGTWRAAFPSDSAGADGHGTASAVFAWKNSPRATSHSPKKVTNKTTTKEWGPKVWYVMHLFSYKYPENPSNEEKNSAKMCIFIQNLNETLFGYCYIYFRFYF